MPPGVEVVGVLTGVIVVVPLPLTVVTETNCRLFGRTSLRIMSVTVCPGATAMLTV